MFDKRKIVEQFSLSEHIVVYPGDCLELLKTLPDGSIKLVVTSCKTERVRSQHFTNSIYVDC